MILLNLCLAIAWGWQNSTTARRNPWIGSKQGENDSPTLSMLKFKFPHPLALLVGCILVAAALSCILPAGQYERRDDPATGRRIVVAGTYHAVASSPISLFGAFVAVPKGMVDAGSV